ncbi:MAG: hypothetical protein ACRBCJ_02475 [Hyphomicrobiaceae bacterium]
MATDNNINGSDNLYGPLKALEQNTLGDFANQITRFQANLSATNDDNGGQDELCGVIKGPPLDGRTSSDHHLSSYDFVNTAKGVADDEDITRKHSLGSSEWRELS